MKGVNDHANKSKIQEKLTAIRKEYTDLGGIWIYEYHQETLGICLFFANYIANAIIKGHFDLASLIAKLPKLLQEVLENSKLQDALLEEIHTNVCQENECHQFMVVIRDYLISLDQLQMIAKLRQAAAESNLKNQISAFQMPMPALNSETLQGLIKNFNEVYIKSYIQRFKLLDQHEMLKKFDAKYYSGVTMTSVENQQLTLQEGKLADDQLNKFIPDFGNALNVLIWEPPLYSFALNDEQGLTLKNQSLETPHYISICFNYYQNKPTFFICDANFGVVAYTDIAQFKVAINKMLTFYIDIHKIQRPHYMCKKLCCDNLLLPTIMSSNEWQTKFSAVGQNDKLPTAALASQLNMPGWAKVVLIHLTNYERTKSNSWEKIDCLFKIKTWLLQENVKLQYIKDNNSQKHPIDLLAQIEQYLTASNKINHAAVRQHVVSIAKQ